MWTKILSSCAFVRVTTTDFFLFRKYKNENSVQIVLEIQYFLLLHSTERVCKTEELYTEHTPRSIHFIQKLFKN